ncbi:MAG: RtcB family protein [Chloroflexi bacterium]|nr:RtcB family protein [Chloroflexota bacterium]
MSEIRTEPVPYKIWGEENIEPGAREQMKHAAELPISVQGALMPDAHQGYGLPIGGVLATRGAVIPYAVGVDIACRMKMTILAVESYEFDKKRDKFRKALEDNTLFGAGKKFQVPNDHEVMGDPLWDADGFIHSMKDTAWEQLGSSGSGNHFVEFGILTVRKEIEGERLTEGEGSQSFGTITPGYYVALLSHSGSRGFGYNVANHFTKIAMSQHAGLPKAYQHLAWLDLDSEEGQRYWQAMNLAGRYASANHAVIHHRIIEALRYDAAGGVENHHNFAWKETHNGEEVFVHRKGATPAGEGVYGVIPGSMTAPGYVVRGKGNPESLNSAAHGAGRRMSRSEAFKRFDWNEVNDQLRRDGVELLAGGLDETPGAYKDIRVVMKAQEDLVDVVAEFQPLIVKMDAGKKDRAKDRRDREKSKTEQKKKRRR